MLLQADFSFSYTDVRISCKTVVVDFFVSMLRETSIFKPVDTATAFVNLHFFTLKSGGMITTTKGF